MKPVPRARRLETAVLTFLGFNFQLCQWVDIEHAYLLELWLALKKLRQLTPSV